MKDPSRVRVAEPLAPYARGFCVELVERGLGAVFRVDSRCS